MSILFLYKHIKNYWNKNENLQKKKICAKHISYIYE